LVPFIKYPSNPPSIGHPETIRQRGGYYLLMVLGSVVLLIAAVWLGQRLKARFGTWNAALLAGAVFVVAAGVVMALLPQLGHLAFNEQTYGNHATETPLPLTNFKGTIVYPGFPADVLFNFRLYSVAAQLLLWSAIGLVFAPMTDRLLAPAQPARNCAARLRTPRCDVPSAVSLLTLPAGELLAGLAAPGPFFAVESRDSGTTVVSPWHPLSTLSGSGEALAARIDAVRSSLAVAAGRPPAAIEFRAAASVAQLGLCARLIAPALGAAARGHPLSIDMMSTRWVPGLGGPFRLSCLTPRSLHPHGRTSLARAHDVLAPLLRLLDGPIRSVVGLTASMGISRRLLWGNVSSAINGAAVMLTAARPGFARESAAISSEVLRFPELISSYRGQPVISFRRQTCCLIYRVAKDAPEYCGDCILGIRIRPQPATSTRRQTPTG
jgi:hypothetical protein